MSGIEPVELRAGPMKLRGIWMTALVCLAGCGTNDFTARGHSPDGGRVESGGAGVDTGGRPGSSGAANGGTTPGGGGTALTGGAGAAGGAGAGGDKGGSANGGANPAGPDSGSSGGSADAGARCTPACSGNNPVCENGTCVECESGSARCRTSDTPEECVGGSWVARSKCPGATPTCSNGVCANAAVAGGVVTVADGILSTATLHLVDHGLEFAPLSCGTVAGNKVCVTGGLRP